MAVTMAGCILFAGCKSDKKISTRSKTTDSTMAVSSEPTKSGGVINHGHSISETTSPRDREISRTSDVILSSEEALKYLKDNVKLNDRTLSFELTATSDDDPGAYMWYEFTIFRNNIKVYNATFDVIAFTDGTICEGRTDAIGLDYGNTKGLLASDKALEIYLEKNSDTDDYKYEDKCYFFGGGNSAPLVYIYKSDNATLFLDADDGTMIGFRPDEID